MRVLPLAMLAAIVATPVMAADLASQSEAVPAAAVAYAFNWTGPELGVFGGGDWANASGSMFDNTSYRFPGGHAGAFAGYQYQLKNNVVLGVEGDASYTGNQRAFHYEDYDTNGNLVASGTAKVRSDFAGSVRARVGYAFDNILVYSTGGWAATRAVSSLSGSGESSKILNGFTVGAGVDYAFTDNLFARVEYRYNRFGEKSLGDAGTIKFDQHLANIGLGMKF